MPESNKFVYLKDKELKKARKIISESKKIILVDYKDSLTYYLYNRDLDFIIVSCNININKEKMLIEKSNKTADKILVLINKIIKISLSNKISLVINKIIKTPPAKTLLITKLANLNHITSLVVKDREIINNSLSRTLISKSRYKRFLKKKTLIDKIILVIKILE